MSKKAVLSIIGLACLVAGIFCAVKGIGASILVYSGIAIGAFLFLGPILGARRVVSLLIVAAISAVAYYAVMYLMGVFGVVLQPQGKTTILLISVLFVYIFSSFVTKRS